MTLPSKSTRNWKNFSLRMYGDDLLSLMALCEALTTAEMRVEPAFLLITAAIEEATLLGFLPSLAIPGKTGSRPRPGTWPYAPEEREGESYRERITITCHPLSLLAIRNAADWAGLPPGCFMLGSLWRFAAKRRQADPGNRRLKAVPIPANYFT